MCRLVSGRCHSAITLVATEHAFFQPVGILSPFTDGTISILFNPVLCHHIAVGIPRFKVFSVSAHVYATWETVQADQRIQIIAAGSREFLTVWVISVAMPSSFSLLLKRLAVSCRFRLFFCSLLLSTIPLAVVLAYEK